MGVVDTFGHSSTIDVNCRRFYRTKWESNLMNWNNLFHLGQAFLVKGKRKKEICYMSIMAMPIVEFSREEYKIRKVFGWKSTVVKWNYQIWRIGVVASCQKVQKFDFQSQFSMSKSSESFWFFLLKNMNLGAHFLLLTFFDKINF